MILDFDSIQDMHGGKQVLFDRAGLLIYFWAGILQLDYQVCLVEPMPDFYSDSEAILRPLCIIIFI